MSDIGLTFRANVGKFQMNDGRVISTGLPVGFSDLFGFRFLDGRKLIVDPNIIADFRNMPFEDESFYLVVFDPPHLLRAGYDSWLGKKYGVLNKDTWKEDIRKGFSECFRVLKGNGTLIFKWNEDQIKLSDILKCTDEKPLFGNRRAKTHWLVFMK